MSHNSTVFSVSYSRDCSSLQSKTTSKISKLRIFRAKQVVYTSYPLHQLFFSKLKTLLIGTLLYQINIKISFFHSSIVTSSLRSSTACQLKNYVFSYPHECSKPPTPLKMVFCYAKNIGQRYADLPLQKKVSILLQKQQKYDIAQQSSIQAQMDSENSKFRIYRGGGGVYTPYPLQV